MARPFYVGISRKLAKRYKDHCSFPFERTHCYIHWIKEEGRLPELTILNQFTSHTDAHKAEITLIRFCVSIGHKLRNDDINPVENTIIECIPYPLDKPRRRMINGYADIEVKKAFHRYEKFRNFHEEKLFRLRHLGNSAVLSKGIKCNCAMCSQLDQEKKDQFQEYRGQQVSFSGQNLNSSS